MKALFIFIVLLNLIYVLAASKNCENKPNGQCGGKDWKGSRCCPSGYVCKTVDKNSYPKCILKSKTTKKSKNNTSNKTLVKTITITTIITKKNTTSKTKLPKNAEENKKTDTTTSSDSSNSASGVIGYASINGGTTGGKGGQTTTVTNQSELEAALKGDSAKIVKVNGIIKLSSDVTVGSNTSLIGANNNSGFTGGGLKFKDAKNIIIQNLKFSFCLGSNADCINAQRSTNIWVDHCEFYNDRNHGKDYYDGLIDFTHASDYITISWNYIHDHYKASLIGHSDTNGAEDTGKLHITYHHNYFKNVGSRLPSLRFGTAHVFNNVYEDIATSSVNVRMGAQALVESNVFRNANRPISTNLDSKQEGSVIQRNNDFGTTAGTNSITKIASLTSVPYDYSADNVNNVYSNVVKNAGPN